MYEKVKSLELKSRASAFNHGLIYYHDKKSDHHMIGCLDVDMINITKYRIIDELAIEQIECCQVRINPIDESTQFYLTELHHFKFMDFDLFCVISSSGLHIYANIEFTRPIFTYSIKSAVELLGALNTYELTFNGVSCLDSFLFLGTSVGVVFVFDMKIMEAREENGLPDKSITFQMGEFLEKHHYSITFINSATDLVHNQSVKVHRLSVADALGNISIWHLDGDKLKFIVQFAGYNNYQCVATKFFEDLIIAAYSSGHIRLFNLIDKCLLCEVSAHAKPITSMNISETGLLITSAEDTFVRVWMLKPDADTYIQQRYCFSIRNCLLTSATFLDEMAKHFVVIAYDESQAFVFQRTSRIYFGFRGVITVTIECYNVDRSLFSRIIAMNEISFTSIHELIANRKKTNMEELG